MPPVFNLQIAAAGDGPALSTQQKRFNTRIRQIEQARQKLIDWETSTAAYRQSHGELLRPLQQALLAGCRQWVFALDDALDRGGWTKSDRQTLTDLLRQSAGELLDGDSGDEPLKALFDKHSEIGFEAEQREHVLAMKDMAEAMMGLDLGDDDGLDTDQALFERLQQGIREQADAQEAARASTSAKRRKTAAQQRREDEDRQATQSVREVYRKLASALHPDRETDPQQRDAKTAMMQRVNRAYDANDLLALLELQLQIEQIDAGHIANAGDERLKYYNKVLGEQLDELKMELEHVEVQFCMEFGLRPGGPKLTPRQLGQLLHETNRAWQAELAEQQRNLAMLADVAATRRWLKRQREQWRRGGFDFDLY